jgi:type II secretory pathway component GspD/PulD (secretin)
MKILLKTLLTVTIALWVGLAGAQQMEIVELQSKSVEQVLPVLMPLLEPGGTLTGMNNQLFLRASPRNRAEIKKALAAMDTPTRRLIIRTSQNRESENNAQGAQVWDTKSVRGERAGQMVQTVEGGQAFIQIGRSLPIPMRQAVIGPGGAIVSETVVYKDVGSGFYAVPHLNGKNVTIEISQQADSVASVRSGTINTQRLSTTVSGQLGEWIALGGGGRQASGNQNGGFSVSTSDARDNRSIWLMVEEVE